MCVETHSLKVTCVFSSIFTVHSITVPPAQKKKVENTNNINCRFNSDFLPIDTPKHR